MKPLVMRRIGERARVLAIVACLLVGGCRVGPDYRAPQIDTPPEFASALHDNATEAAESRLAADWWTIYDDAQLETLETEAVAHNQDLLAAAARVVQARAAARVASSQLYPTVSLDPSIVRGRSVTNRGATTTTQVRVPLDVAYEVDTWGRVSREREAATAQMYATADDFGVVRLTLCADVAQGWFALRSLDAQIGILTRSIALFERQVELTTTQQRVGIVGQTDVAQAQTQLETARGQLVDVRRQRADAEHALAILTGQAPSEVSLAVQPLTGAPPSIPPGLPADLLRRRPDVASAEHALVAANASVGIAQANFYPTLTLTGSAGWESLDPSHTFDWGNRIWSLGAGLVAPIFEGGKLSAEMEQAKARYDEVLATYRSAVLTAFREVEDALTDLHLGADAADAQARAVAAARESQRLAQMQYDQGLVGYLQVLDAQRTLLAAELTLEQIQNQRFAASVLLIKALGGGWTPDASRADARAPAAVGPP